MSGVPLHERRRQLARLARNNETPSAAQQAYEDLFWTLLNSSEFIFNH